MCDGLGVEFEKSSGVDGRRVKLKKSLRSRFRQREKDVHGQNLKSEGVEPGWGVSGFELGVGHRLASAHQRQRE